MMPRVWAGLSRTKDVAQNKSDMFHLPHGTSRAPLANDVLTTVRVIPLLLGPT